MSEKTWDEIEKETEAAKIPVSIVEDSTAYRNLKASHDAILAASQKAIDTHRTESFITCEETCWCWDLEAAIELARKEGAE